MKIEIRAGTYAQIADMGWREKVEGEWIDPCYGDKLYASATPRYDACAIAGFGLYIDKLGLMSVYLSRHAAERARQAYLTTGLIP